jgi:ATP-dependent RNA helicase DeaD
MDRFRILGLNNPLIEAVTALGYEAPTPIQEQVIPLALNGRDIIGSAQTGSGKTGAYGLPLAFKLMSDEIHSALVIVPTRELAMQTMKAILSFLPPSLRKRNALLISGKNMREQLSSLRQRPKLIVGTPGRINDHLERGTLDISQTDFLVLDETDRMLDMGFSIQINDIVRFLPEKRQTLLFSATFPSNIVRTAQKYLQNPAEVMLEVKTSIMENITHETMHIEDDKKYDALVLQLAEREGSIIVFVNTKVSADKICYKLQKLNESVDAIHGDLKHSQRASAIQRFRDKKSRVIIATDIAARGLDVPHVEHVINFDIPTCPEDYIHRIGRTARAGRTGSAICFISSSQKKKWFAVDRLINPNAKPEREGSSRNSSSSRGRSDRKSSFGGRRSDDRKPSFGGRSDDRKQSFGGRSDDRKPSFGGRSDDRKPSFGGRSDDRKPSFGGRSDDRKPSFGGRSDDRKPAFGGRSDDRKPAFGGRSDDRKPSFGGRSDDRKPSFGGRSDDRKPAFGVARRDDRKPSFNDSRSTEKRPELSLKKSRADDAA